MTSKMILLQDIIPALTDNLCLFFTPGDSQIVIRDLNAPLTSPPKCFITLTSNIVSLTAGPSCDPTSQHSLNIYVSLSTGALISIAVKPNVNDQFHIVTFAPAVQNQVAHHLHLCNKHLIYLKNKHIIIRPVDDLVKVYTMDTPENAPTSFNQSSNPCPSDAIESFPCEANVYLFYYLVHGTIKSFSLNFKDGGVNFEHNKDISPSQQEGSSFLDITRVPNSNYLVAYSATHWFIFTVFVNPFDHDQLVKTSYALAKELAYVSGTLLSTGSNPFGREVAVKMVYKTGSVESGVLLETGTGGYFRRLPDFWYKLQRVIPEDKSVIGIDLKSNQAICQQASGELSLQSLARV